VRFGGLKPFWPLALVQQALPAIFLAALRRFRGTGLLRGLRPSSSLGAPFWPLGLTLRSGGPAFCGPLTLSVSLHVDEEQPKMETFASPVYQISPDSIEKQVISAMLNEAEHVFRWHTDGAWKTTHKEHYARLLASHLKIHPKLIRNINNLNNRVFSMIVYRAVELLNEQTSS